MAITITASSFASTEGVTATSVSKALGVNTTSGRIQIAICFAYNPGAWGTSAVTDTQTNTWVRNQVVTRVDGFTLAIYSTKCATSAANTVTATPLSSSLLSLYVFELTGADATTWFDKGNSKATSSGSPIDSDNITTGAAGGMAFAAVSHEQGTTALTPGSGWSQLYELEDASGIPVSILYRTTAAATLYTGQWTTGGTLDYLALIANYFEAAGAETITVDKWFQRPGEVTRRPVRVVASGMIGIKT